MTAAHSPQNGFVANARLVDRFRARRSNCYRCRHALPRRPHHPGSVPVRSTSPETPTGPGPAESGATGRTPCGRRGRGRRARRFARACQLGTRAARGRIRSTDGRGSGVCATHGPHGRRFSTVACHGANVVRPDIRMGRARRLRRLHAELRRRQRALHQAPHRLGLRAQAAPPAPDDARSVRSTPAGCPPSGCWRRAPTASASG